MFTLWKFPSALLSVSVAFLVMASSPTATARGGSGADQLVSRLRSSDFRVQVQAALILGKSGDIQALSALSRALSDSSVAVRAAAAAALSTLGDPAALPALRRAARDKSPAVRRRIRATVANLEKERKFQAKARRSAKILVKLGSFESHGASEVSEALAAAAVASKKAISSMSSVALLNASEEPQAASQAHNRPVILMRPSIRRLSRGRSGDQTVVSARVEFVVEKYPERSIKGRLSGDATAKSDVDSRRARIQLEEEAVSAAVLSALRRSRNALLAAGQAG